MADQPTRIRSASPSHLGASLQGVTFGYPGASAVILADFTLDVRSGEFLSVVGPSGCGKSTLLRLVAGLVRPQAGAVSVGESQITGPSEAVSVVFQSDTLLPWRTALKNVRFGIEGRMKRKVATERSRELLRLVGLEDDEAKYPHQLSGGMRQRVNLARALATDPSLLLMDEPFAALDAQTRELQQEHLLKIWRQTNKTVLFVTHDIDEAVFLADRVVVLGLPPAGIVYGLDVTLDRPRKMAIKATAEFRDSVESIRRVIGSHVAAAGHRDSTAGSVHTQREERTDA